MKKSAVAFILTAAIVGPGNAFPLDKRTLAGVFEPGMIKIADDRIYVVEGAKILAFTLSDMGLVRQFGRQGEGPGELKETDFWYNTMTILPEEIFIDGYDKAVYFSKDGRFIKEVKKPVGISQLAPVGKNFAAVQLDYIEGEVQYQRLSLYDSNLEFVKELSRQKSPIQSLSRKSEIIPDVLNFSVWAEKIFVETSRAGFVIDVFDSRGSPLYRIEKPSKKIPVTQEHKEQAIEAFKDDPFVKRFGFEEFKKFSELVWPASLPAIRDFLVVDEKIYVRTFKMQNDKENWIILDLKGQTLADIYLPPVEAAPLMANLYGIHYYTIHENRLYFLNYKEDSGVWELHTMEIR
jgi:hypothetical protein